MMGPTTRKFFGFAGSVAVHAAILAVLLSPNTLSVKPSAELVSVEFIDHPTSPIEAKIEAPKFEAPKIETQQEKPIEAKEKFVKAKPKPVPKIPAKRTPKISAPEEPAPAMPEPVEKAISENEEPVESAEENVVASETEAPQEDSENVAPLNVIPERQEIHAEDEVQESTGAPETAAPLLPPGPATGSTGKMIDEAQLEPMPGNMRPQYSYMARLQKMQGTVVIKAFVRRDGKMNPPILERSSGHGHLDDLALKAFSQWRWVPGPSGWLRKEFVFRIADTDKSKKVSQF